VNLPELGSKSLEELSRYVEKASPNELEVAVSQMNIEQLQQTILQIDKDKDAKWKQKIRAVILGLNNRSQLEIAAAKLTVDQVIELIDKTLQLEDKHHWKLSPLLVGMQFEIFAQILSQASPSQLQVLQHEGVTEPVQHQLTALSHELSNQILEIETEIDRIDEELENLKLNEMDREDVLELQHQIGVYSEFFERCFQQANKALAIAWNTNRLDLIESLNKIKDSCQKYNIYGVGLPRNAESPATGLYNKIELKLFSIYGDPEDPSNREALRDNEPALEALVKFSIWYLRDYWELGLLPSVKRQEDLDLDLSKHSELERTHHREQLFTQAQNNLKHIGLATVSDLKNAYIFSKKTLREYIQEKLNQKV
jgi:hypothetical protein